MLERFAQSARTSVEDARHEAARRGDRPICTDHLLLALLDREEPDSAAALFAALSVDRQTVRNSLTAA